MSSTATGQVTVSTTEDLRKALAAGYTGEQITLASHDALIASARTEGLEAGRKESTESAVKAERTRIARIRALARAGFDAELKIAIDEGHSPEAFAMTLLTAAADRGITLDAIAKDSPPPAAHAKPGDGDQRPQVRSANDIYKARREAAASAANAR